MSIEDDLLAMPDDEFVAVVNQDLRKAAPPATVAALRSSAVFDRWWGQLVAFSKSSEGVLGARREEYLASHANVLGRIKKAQKDLARNKRLGNTERVEAAEDKLSALDDELYRLLEDYHHGRAGSLRFKSGLDEWMAHAASLRRMRRRDPPTD